MRATSFIVGDFRCDAINNLLPEHTADEACVDHTIAALTVMVQDIADRKAEREASELSLDRSLDRSNPTYTNLRDLSTAFLDLLHIMMAAACASLPSGTGSEAAYWN
jgi:formiminotetrahydrofolate cyclodeaminase